MNAPSKSHLAEVETLYRDWAVTGGYPTLRSDEYQAVLRSCPLLNQPGQRVLDVGCGVGVVAKEMQALGHSVSGVDMVKEALDIALADNRIERGYLGEFTTLDIPPASHDVIVFWGVLLYVFDLDKAFRHSARVLRPGGQILVVDHHSRNPYTKLHFSRPDWVDRLLEGRSNTERRALNAPLIQQNGSPYFDWDAPRYWSHFTRHPNRNIDRVHSVARFAFRQLHRVATPSWAHNFISMSGVVKPASGAGK